MLFSSCFSDKFRKDVEITRDLMYNVICIIKNLITKEDEYEKQTDSGRADLYLPADGVCPGHDRRRNVDACLAQQLPRVLGAQQPKGFIGLERPCGADHDHHFATVCSRVAVCVFDDQGVHAGQMTMIRRVSWL